MLINQLSAYKAAIAALQELRGRRRLKETGFYKLAGDAQDRGRWRRLLEEAKVRPGI